MGDHGCEYMTGGRVLVLGGTGRNFGAGMSGGIAYVYDADGTFGERVNYEMVQLEDLDGDDVEFVRELVARHQEYTDSDVAKALLVEWEQAVGRFRKIMPLDYRRVLEATKAAEAAGLSDEETLQKVMGL